MVASVVVDVYERRAGRAFPNYNYIGLSPRQIRDSRQTAPSPSRTPKRHLVPLKANKALGSLSLVADFQVTNIRSVSNENP